MATNVRYIVNTTDDIGVYELLGFRVLMHPSPGFVALERDGVKLFLNVPGGGGGAGIPVRGDVIDGIGGRQALVEDTSGNAIELFEPKPR